MISHKQAHAKLDGMCGKELVSYHNELAVMCGERSTKRFSTLAAGRRRCLRLMALCGHVSKTDDVVRRRKPRKTTFRYPANGRPDGAPALSTPGTLYQRIQMVLLAGETFDGVCRLVEEFDIMRGVVPFNVEHRAYSKIREQHLYYGWGLKEEEREEGTFIYIFSDIPPKKITKRQRIPAHAV